jgi:hypothetical protein
MKNKKPVLSIIAGLIIYSLFYIATTIKEPLCYGQEYDVLRVIEDSVSKIKGVLYQRVNDEKCNSMEIGINNQDQQQYVNLGDSICAYSKKIGYPLKSVMIVSIDTALSLRDTLSITQCPN